MNTNAWHRFAIPAVAALIVGAMNAMTGGGSFLSFRALLSADLLPVTANATNTVAMWPGDFASVLAFRRELRSGQHGLMSVVMAGALGGAAGSFALLETSQAVRFQYKWHDAKDQWCRSYGPELWEFAPSGLMQRREASTTSQSPRKNARSELSCRFCV